MRSTAAVLGSPIHHSLSPIIHNLAYKQLGIEREYIAVEIKENEFLDWIRPALTETNQWFGFSLTMPLKEVVCDESLSDIIQLDALSKTINSANTLYLKEGQWQGCSTDVIGFQNLLKGIEFSSVSILGAGGTARAALGALSTAPQFSQVRVYRRDSKRDSSLIRAGRNQKLEIHPWSDLDAGDKHDLVINTVPNIGVAEIAEKFSGARTLLDAIYSPWPTALMKRQQQDGMAIISGLELLCAQAVPQIELMTGISFDHAALFKLALEELHKYV
ncbi:MAG: hypothetical protein RLZZ159_616 [Actinomycetota bacterium]|jgi:shikimate dehydrogenase